MSLSIMEPSRMAKKMGRPKTERDDVTVKLDRKLAGMAKAVATANGISVGEYLSKLANTPVQKDYAKMLQKLDAAEA